MPPLKAEPLDARDAADSIWWQNKHSSLVHEDR